MNTTFDTVKTKIIRILNDEVSTDGDYGDPLSGNTYSADLLKDAVHAALDALTIRFGKQLVVEIEGGVSEDEMPDDLLSIEGVYDKKDGLYLPRMSIQANQSSLVGIETNAWTEYPYGSITFVNELPEEGATVYYSATWEKPEDDDESLEPPTFALTAIVLYAASYCLLNQASGSANIRQFNTKVDSGQPTDIPAKDMSDFFLKRFEIELQRIPSQEKGVLR